MFYQSIRIQIAIITKLINNTKFKIDKGDHLLDTHTHILWNIDDGSKNQFMSLQMLEIAARSGTKAIFATPQDISTFSFIFKYAFCSYLYFHRTCAAIFTISLASTASADMQKPDSIPIEPGKK